MADEEAAPALSREALGGVVRKMLLQSPPGELAAVATSASQLRARVLPALPAPRLAGTHTGRTRTHTRATHER
jgi:hypothetical protein